MAIESADQVNVIVAMGALAVASFSLIVSVVTLFIQRIHNRKSVNPVAQFHLKNYVNCLEISLSNKGIGPMIIKSFRVSIGDTRKTSIIDHMPDLPKSMPWRTYIREIDGRALAPNEEITLLRFDGKKDDKKFCKLRDKIRDALAPGVMTIEYTDVYNSTLPSKIESLDWFEREQESDSAESKDAA